MVNAMSRCRIARRTAIKICALVVGLSLAGCGHKVHVQVQDPRDAAFEVTREDGMVFIMQFPENRRTNKTVEDLKKVAGCEHQVCILQLIRLQRFHQAGKK